MIILFDDRKQKAFEEPMLNIGFGDSAIVNPGVQHCG
jgi:hypothetical protein